MWMMPLHLHVNQKSDYDDMMTVKSDYPMQENYEIFKDLIQNVGLLY